MYTRKAFWTNWRNHGYQQGREEAWDFWKRELRFMSWILRRRSCSRLNIYRRCFQHLCDNFKIYGELMTEIKVAYENMITIMKDDSSVLDASNKSLKKGLNKTEQELIVKSRRWKIARWDWHFWGCCCCCGWKLNKWILTATEQADYDLTTWLKSFDCGHE